LWDDITKQFLDHTDPSLLTAATKAIFHLTSNAAGEAANNEKLMELDETIFTSLRDTINGEEVFSMSLDEDRLTKIQAILLRISLLQRSRDITQVMEDEEGGQSSGWEIVCAFAERGDVGYKEEANVSRIRQHTTLYLC
jgi:cohesin complex subunit SA-1/2